MGLITQQATIGAEGTAIPGSRSWPMAQEGPSVERIAAVYPADIVAWPQPGRVSPSGNGVVPISDGDAADATRRWIGRGAAGATRLTDAGVLAGLPRWRASRVASVDGIAGDLGTPLASYSMAFLYKANDLSANNGVYCIGTDMTSRNFLYQAANGTFVHQHGTGDQLTVAGAFAAGLWHAILVSFDDATRAFRLFVNGTSPVGQATKANGSPAVTGLTFLCAANGTNPANAELVPYGIWRRALHLDGSAVSQVMTGLGGLSSL